jgi:hypothetical protein
VGRKFGVAYSCVDGQARDATIPKLKSRFGLDHIDEITDLGIVGVLANASKEQLVTFKHKAEALIKGHEAEVLYIVAHSDCLGNPLPYEVQTLQVKKVIQIIESWYLVAPSGNYVRIVGVFADKSTGEVELLHHPVAAAAD